MEHIKKIEIIYIGNSENMLDYLMSAKQYRMKGIIVEKKKMPSSFVHFSKKMGIELERIESKEEMKAVLKKWNISVAVMYDFGIIIPKEVLDEVDVFNFHSGSLKENRGSSPIHWSILLGNKQTEMSLYKISPEIDLGEIVSISKCEIDKHDIPSTLRAKLETKIPEMLDDLSEFINFNKRGVTIKEGVYRPRLKKEDYTINAETDTEFDIVCKIRSQADYQGAVYAQDGKEYYVKSLYEYYKILDRI